MQVTGLDHVTLRTASLDATKSFFVDVAGLAVGPRPPFAFPGYWLYQGATPVLHLAAPDPGLGELDAYLGKRTASASVGSGAVDHIAFRCTGLAQLESRLASLGVAYSRRTVPDLREHQVFVRDPNHVVVEFIFSSSEQASWAADTRSVGDAPTA